MVISTSMNECPVCKPPDSCKGYPALWERLGRPDGHRWREIHDRMNSVRHVPDLAALAEWRRLAEVKRCRWLDRKCGCQWGNCTNPLHERHGKEVGYAADCKDCTLFEEP
jgi:hypothetical protein